MIEEKSVTPMQEPPLKTYAELKEWLKAQGITGFHASVDYNATEEEVVAELYRLLSLPPEAFEEWHD